MPSKRTKQASERRERSPSFSLKSWTTELVFAVAVMAMCALWLGLTLQARIDQLDPEIVRRAGIGKIFIGADAAVNLFFLIVGVTIAYLAALWALRRGFRHSFAAALIATVLGCLAFMPSGILTSPDAVHLAADVRTLWLHGKMPTARENAPARVDDPVAREVRVFSHDPSGYGPVAYAVGGLPLPFVGDGLRANVFGQKVVAALFFVLVAALTGVAARQLGGDPGLAAGLIGLNPLFLWEFPGDGHNDVVMAAFGMAAFLLISRERWRPRVGGLGLAALAVLSKYSLILASPVLAAYWFPRWRGYLAAALGLAGAVVFIVIGLRLYPALGIVGPAGTVVRTTPWGLVSDRTGVWSSGHTRQLVATAYVSYFVALAYMAAYYRMAGPRELAGAFAVALFIFTFVCYPGMLPWYQVWCMPFAIISGKRWLIVATVAFSIGEFLPIIALNYSSAIQREMGIDSPVQKAVVVLYVTVAALAIGFQRADAERARGRSAAPGPRARAAAATRRARGRA